MHNLPDEWDHLEELIITVDWGIGPIGNSLKGYLGMSLNTGDKEGVSDLSD